MHFKEPFWTTGCSLYKMVTFLATLGASSLETPCRINVLSLAYPEGPFLSSQYQQNSLVLQLERTRALPFEKEENQRTCGSDVAKPPKVTQLQLGMI